jgi:hypothetical protein
MTSRATKVEVRVAACLLLISTAKRKSESSFIRTLWRKFLGCPPALRFIQKKFIYGSTAEQDHSEEGSTEGMSHKVSELYNDKRAEQHSFWGLASFLIDFQLYIRNL